MQRVAIQTLKHCLVEPDYRIQVVIGARQVGKTTLVHFVLSELPFPYVYETADSNQGIPAL